MVIMNRMTATAATDPAPTGRRGGKKQRTREALIDAAFTLFAEKGFEATTVEEIADMVAVIRACEEGEYGFDPKKFLCVQQLMESSPTVFARSLEHGEKKQREITRV